MAKEEQLSLFDTLKAMKLKHYVTTAIWGIGSYWWFRILAYFGGVWIYENVGREQVTEWLPYIQFMTEAEIYQHWFDDPLVNTICIVIGLYFTYSQISRYGRELAPKTKSTDWAQNPFDSADE